MNTTKMTLLSVLLEMEAMAEDIAYRDSEFDALATESEDLSNFMERAEEAYFNNPDDAIADMEYDNASNSFHEFKKSMEYYESVCQNIMDHIERVRDKFRML